MRNAGFTLIELMIAVAILAIVATVALPLYNEYSQRTYRTEAQADLLNCAQGLERYAAQNFDYEDAEVGFPGDICDPRSDDQNRYVITVNVPDADAYTLTATPVAGGPAPAGNLTLDQAGNRTWNGNPGWED